LKITEFSKFAGVSIRTLHYYDEIGLLTPTRCDQNNRREYSGDDFLTLQLILFYKETGLSLKEIKSTIETPCYDSKEILELQIEHLKQQRSAIDKRIRLIEAMTASLTPSSKDHTSGNEIDSLIGEQASSYGQSLLAGMPDSLQRDIADSMQAEIAKLAKVSDLDPAGSKAQKAIKAYHIFLNRTHGNMYSIDLFSRLGNFYMQSEVFRRSLDDTKEGLSDFMQKAIAEYVLRAKAKMQ